MDNLLIKSTVCAARLESNFRVAHTIAVDWVTRRDARDLSRDTLLKCGLGPAIHPQCCASCQKVWAGRATYIRAPTHEDGIEQNQIIVANIPALHRKAILNSFILLGSDLHTFSLHINLFSVNTP